MRVSFDQLLFAWYRSHKKAILGLYRRLSCRLSTLKMTTRNNTTATTAPIAISMDEIQRFVSIIQPPLPVVCTFSNKNGASKAKQLFKWNQDGHNSSTWTNRGRTPDVRPKQCRYDSHNDTNIHWILAPHNRLFVTEKKCWKPWVHSLRVKT